MDGCNVDSVSDPRGGGKRFTIYRLDGRMIQKQKSIEFVSNFAMEDQWIEGFKEIGIYQKEIMYSSSLSLFSEDDQVIYCILNGSFQLWNFFNVGSNLVRSLTKNKHTKISFFYQCSDQ